MRRLTFLILCAAAPAAAQLRVAIAVEGNVGRTVPAVGMEARREYSPTTLPAMSLSLFPSISAPSVSPRLSAVVLPVLSRPSVAVQNPLPSPLTRAVLPSASIADAVRAEAAKAISDRKASRSLTSSAEVPAPPSAENPSIEEPPSVQLDALFDGSLPASREVLSRAKSLGLRDPALALAISASKSPSEAAARLSALGVLGSQEAVLSASDENGFRFLLTRLWRKTAPSIPAAFKVDKRFGIPALKVERDGVTYFVHGVSHGTLGTPRRWAVLSTVRKVKASGQALYSEQNLPAYYGYKYGLETLDHAVGAPVQIVPAAAQYTASVLLLKCLIDLAAIPVIALAALALVIIFPASPWSLALLSTLGGLPLMRWKRRNRAAAARAEGLEDIAEQYADEAENFFVSKPDLEILRGLELPQPLGASAHPLSVRSRAIADAVAADAAAAGATAVHLIVGHLHAHEIAWRLANGPRRTVPKSQIS